MSRLKFSRRTVLRGAGGIAVALPFLDSLNAHAAGVDNRCAVFVFSPNGTAYQWAPSGTENSWQLSPVLQPLAEHKNELIVIKGLDQNVGGPGDPHQQGVASLLTGESLLNGNEFGVGESQTERVGWGGGISLDQKLAQTVGANSPVPVLNLGVKIYEYRMHGRWSYFGPNSPAPNEGYPSNVFDRLFSNFAPGSMPVDTTGVERVRREKRSVLDFVKADHARVSKRASATDRERLEEHFNAIRELELRIDAIGPVAGTSATCSASPEQTDPRYGSDNYPEVLSLMTDLAVMGLACGRTRIVTLMWGGGVSNQTFPWLNIPDNGPMTDQHH
jgi:hypothetical protein